MKTKNLLRSLFILGLVMGFVSCSENLNNDDPTLYDQDIGMKSLVIDTENPFVVDPSEFCGDPQVFEMYYGYLESERTYVGTVTIYNDNENFYIRYDVYPAEGYDWGIHRSWLYVGPYEGLPVDENGYLLTDGMVKNSHGEMNPASATITIPLEELDECFVVGTKALLITTPYDPNDYLLKVAYAYVNVNGELDRHTWDYEYCIQYCEGTGTPGFWKNHPEAWPTEFITIGGMDYPRDIAIDFMKSKVKGDKTYNMFAQLVAAKLNVLIGSTSFCITDVIDQADAWMIAHPVGSGVTAKSMDWQDEGSMLHSLLDEYNNGLLCAGHRE